MMRLLGVLVGSALAVGALVVFVGIPEFTTEKSVADNTIITLPMRPTAGAETAPVDGAETGPGPEPTPSHTDTSADGPETMAAAEAEAPAAPPQPEPDIGMHAELHPDTAADIPDVSQVADEPRQWYAFWSPFRSEIAASGFVDQLQRVTGLDYRVVKVKPGVYEVAFAYADDDEITSNLSQISAATGLQLPEG